MIRPGKPWHHWRHEITEAVQYLGFSEAFGWTPEQVDGLDDFHRLNYLGLLKGMSLAKKE